jgi:uncharacterized protein (DUF302 family)
MFKLKRVILALTAVTALQVSVLHMSAFAEDGRVKVASNVTVNEAVMRLKGAVEKAGARVFSIVDYAKGTASVGVTLRPTTLVIFGSPKIGATALKVGQTMGLYLPLRILAYEDTAGKVWLLYSDPADAAVKHGIPADHPAVVRMQAAIAKMARFAAGG